MTAHPDFTPGPDGRARRPTPAPDRARSDQHRRYLRAVEGWMAGSIRARAHELRRLRPSHTPG